VGQWNTLDKDQFINNYTLPLNAIYYGIFPKTHFTRIVNVTSNRPFKIALENVNRIQINSRVISSAQDRDRTYIFPVYEIL